jgi:hypothetical protein
MKTRINEITTALHKVAEHPIGVAALQKLTTISIIVKGDAQSAVPCVLTYTPESKALAIEFTFVNALAVMRYS